MYCKGTHAVTAAAFTTGGIGAGSSNVLAAAVAAVTTLMVGAVLYRITPKARKR